jgi:hypothetical protein
MAMVTRFRDLSELTRDPLGQLVAMAASAGDLGPAVALAALREGAERYETPRGTGLRRPFRRRFRPCRGALALEGGVA